LAARELTLWYEKNWQKYYVAKKPHHYLERIMTSILGTYWHTNVRI